MANVCRIDGVDAVLARFREAHRRHRRLLRAGCLKAGLHLQRKSQDIVPVQLGNLKASAFTRDIAPEGQDTDVVVGYTAAYAIYVHENMEATHGSDYNALHAEEIANPNRKHTAKSGNFNRGSNQQAKFLERPFREEQATIRQIIRDVVRGGLR